MKPWLVTYKQVGADEGQGHSLWETKDLANPVCEYMEDAFYDPNKPARWFSVQLPEGNYSGAGVCNSEDFMKIMDSTETLKAEMVEDRQIAEAISHSE